MKTQRIVFLVVFICAGLMSSLFVFHLKNKPLKTNLANDNGIVFPVSREIKPFDLVSANEKKFDLKNFYGHWTLLFFGFTHCAQVCPNTLGMIAQAYPKLIANNPTLQVVLISVDPERDSTIDLKKYTESFNTNFIGVSGKINELRKLQSQLGIYSERDGTKANYQIRHTPSILLINPKGEWAGLIKYGLSPDEFIDTFNQALQRITSV